MALTDFYFEELEETIDKLLEWLDTCGLRQGDKLMAEEVLSRLLKEDTSVVHQAVYELINRGNLTLNQAGEVLVAPPRIFRNMLTMSSLSQAIRASNFQITSIVIESGICEAAKEEASALNLPLGAKVFRLHRVRMVDDVPLLLEITYLPAKQFRELTQYDFNIRTLYAVLEERYGIRAVSQEQEFMLTLPTKSEMHLLGIAPNEPLIVQFGRTCDQNGLIFEYSISKALGNRFAYQSLSTLKD